MSTTIIAEKNEHRTIRQPIEQVDKAVIDDLLAHVAAVPTDHYWTLDEGDLLYNAPTDVLVVRASGTRNPESIEVGSEHVFADFYDLNGHRLTLSERPDDWFSQQSEIRKPGTMWGTPNAVHRLGNDYLMIGRGQWYVTGETTIDGERAFEFGSGREYFARLREQQLQEKREFLEANPIIEASMPWWSKDLNIEQSDELGEVLVTYGYSIGVDDLYFYQDATLKGGKLTLGKVEFQNGYHTVPLEKYADLANQFRGFADVLDRIAQEAH